MSGYVWKKYGLHRFTALLLAGVLVVESAEFGTLTVAAQESVNSGEPAGVSVNEIQGATLDGGDSVSEDMGMFNACGYVPAPGEVPAPASELNLSLDQAKRLLENTDPARARVMAAGQMESVPAAYPYSYDQTENLGSYLEEKLPAVRNQNPYGTCWAHASTGAVEMDMITRYGEPTTIDYSELHLIYWSLHQGSNLIMGDTGDVVNDSAHEDYMYAGGNSTMTSQALLRRRGIAAEETLPYSEANTAAADEGTLTADPKDEFNDVAYLNNHYRISISGNAGNVKEAIMEHGGVQVSYYDSASYYSSTYNSFYNPTVKSTNHAVMLVGWDDSFPKESFSSEPSGDGAWLVRNSWGYASYGLWSHQKYFWMSYYDAGLLKCDTADVFEMIPADQGYDNQYFYDSQLCINGYYSSNDMKAANVYTVGGKRTSSAEQELLEAVSIVLVSADAPYTIEVYTGLSDGSDPTSGTLAATMSGTAVFAGEYTIELPEPVTLKRGELFSVVVTGNTAQEANYSSDSVVAVNEGESFINWGYGWKDQAINGYSGYGNFRIYALTRDAGEAMIQNLTVSREGTSASLTWDAFESADSYAIYRGETSGLLSKIGETNAETTSYTDTGIDTGKVYYYQIKTNSGANVSGIRKLLRNLTASDVTVSGTGRYTYDGQEKAFQVIWPEGVGAKSLVYYKVTENGSDEETLTAFGTGDKILMPGTYQLGIRLAKDGTVFAASDAIVTDNAWRIVIDKKTLTKNDFTFEAGQTFVADGEVHFVRPITDYASEQEIVYKFAVLNSDETLGEFSENRPIDVGTYQVSVSGSETDICNSFTDITDTTWRFDIIPQEIENLRVNRTGEVAVLSWDALESADTYDIYRGETAAELTKIASVNGNVTTYTDSGVDAGKIYYYQIKTNSGVNKSQVMILLREFLKTDAVISGTGTFEYDKTEKQFTVVYPDGIGNAEEILYRVEKDDQDKDVLTALSSEKKILMPGTYQLGIQLTEDGTVFAKSDAVVTDITWRIIIGKVAIDKSDFLFDSNALFVEDGQVHFKAVELNCDYDGNLQYEFAVVDPDTGSVGEYSENAPMGVGIYQVSVSGSSTDTYEAFDDITDEAWRFRIVEDTIENLVLKRNGITAELSWDPAKLTDGYIIYRGTNQTAVDTKIAELEADTCTYTDTVPDTKTLYYYRVESNKGMSRSKTEVLLKELYAADLSITGTGIFIYDGRERKFTIGYPSGIGDARTVYYRVGLEQSGKTVLTELNENEKIVYPGNYQLGIQLISDGDEFAKTSETVTDSSWSIAILRAQIYKDDFTFTEGGIFTADGEAHSVKPQAPENYTGTLSYKYAPVNGSTVGAYTAEEPTGVGIWQVSVDGTTTEIYDSFTGLTDSTWRFRIVEPVTAAKPTAKIESGEAGDGVVTDGARITLATATSGAVIYYTLDGSVPTMEKGVKYTGGITLSRKLFGSAGELTLKAAAFKSSADGYVVSDILECVYRIKEADYGEILDEDIRADWTSPDDVPDGIWIGGLPKEVPYTGKAIRFDDLRIYDHVTLLTPDDYKITYSPNVNAGIVTVTVKGNGNYTGQKTDTFTITKADIGAAQETGALAVDDLYLKATGKDLTGSIKPTVKWNGITLKLNKDYKVVPGTEGEEVKEARSEWYVLKLDADAAGSQNFTGKAYFKVKVYEAVTVNLSKVSVTKIPTQVFRADLPEGYTSVDQLKGADGQPLAFVVKNGKEEVPAGAYSVRFENADRSGTATLILTATEDGSDDGASDGDQAEGSRTKYVYTGVKKVTFKIASTPAKNAFAIEPISDQIYTGSEVTPKITVKDKDGKLLKEYTACGAEGAYTVKYSGNIKAGTAKAVITGRAEAGYSGSLTVKFKINKYGLQYDKKALRAATCDISYDNVGGAVRYVKGQTNPAVTVRVPSDKAEGGWITLAQGTDYTVKYTNNKAVANETDLPEKKKPTITITGKGGYTTPKGGIKLYYSIVTKDIDSDEITKSAKDKVYKNAVNSYKSAPVLTDANGKVLKAGTDYEKDFEYVYAAAVDVEHKEGQEYIKVPRYTGDPVDANDIVPVGAVIKVIIHGANNYTGDTEVSYRIVKYDLAKAKVTVKPQTYTGAPVYPDGTAESNLSGAAAGGNGADVTVTLGGKPLTYGTDYTITDWSDNVKAGKNKASLTIAGCEDNPEYGGSKKVKFSIIQKKF